MHEALMVNPYETNEFAEVLHRALTMPKDERELRMYQLRKREKQNDVNFWLRSFLKSVQCLDDSEPKSNLLQPLDEEDFSNYLSDYVNESSRLALLLDYDGTLAPIAPHRDHAIIPEETLKLLERLAGMPDVNVAIITGRSLANIQQMVGINGITYAGNLGFQILHPDGTLFSHPVPSEYLIKLKSLKSKLEEIKSDGAWVEDKESVVTFHYREVPSDLRESVKRKVRTLFQEHDLTCYESKMALESRPPVKWDKGRAAIHILRTLFGVDWCGRVSTIFVGDDSKDEDAFKVLTGMAVTFRVTNSIDVKTFATHRLPDTDAVFKMLKWIERRLGFRPPSSSYLTGNPGTAGISPGKMPSGSPRRRLNSDSSNNFQKTFYASSSPIQIQ